MARPLALVHSTCRTTSLHLNMNFTDGETGCVVLSPKQIMKTLIISIPIAPDFVTILASSLNIRR